MTNIPTAKEFWDSKCKTDELKSPGDIMIEFAKIHVEAALKAASEKARIKSNTQQGNFMFIDDFVVKKESILNSYPLENIE